MKTFIKIIILAPIMSSFLIAIIFIGVGTYEMVQGIEGIIRGQIHTQSAPAIKLLEALDIFLIAFLFLISSIGFAQLFLPKPSRIADALEKITPEWLVVENFIELKLILWDTVLTTLVVMFVNQVYHLSGNFSWNLVILPLAILIIASSKFVMKFGQK